MDKKSNRTDLLAAGRKKLQQFRQKKDNKGKDGRGKEGKGQKIQSASKLDTAEQRDEDNKTTSTFTEDQASASEPSQGAEVSASEPSEVVEASASEPPQVVEASASEPSEVAKASASEPSRVAEASASEPSRVAEASASEPSRVPEASASEPSRVAEASAYEPSQVAEASASEPSCIPEASASDRSQVTEASSSELSDVAVGVTFEPSQVSIVETESLSNSNQLTSVPIEDSTNVAFEEEVVRIAPLVISDNVEKDGAPLEPADLMIVDSSVTETNLFEKNRSLASNEMNKPGDCGVETGGDVNPSQVLIAGATVTESNQMAFELIDTYAGQKEDQVSDVGAMQEAKNADTKAGNEREWSSPREHDTLSLPILDVAVKSPVLSGSNQENSIADDQDPSTNLDEPASQNAMVEGAYTNLDESASQNAMVEGAYDTVACPVAAVSHSDHHDGHLYQHSDDMIMCHAKEVVRGHAYVDGCRSGEGFGQDFSRGSESNPPTSGVDGQFLSLMELADIIKGLSQDDYMFLVKSRGDWEIDNHDQQKQSSDEISTLTSSLVDAQQRNKMLEAELLQSRSELEDAIYRTEDLQNHLFSVKTEVQELSGRIDEMKIIIEESTIRNEDLTTELAGYKHLLANSQAENELLSNTLSSVSEEKRELINVKEQYFDEIQHLSSELAYHRSSVTAMLVEFASLNVSLAVVIDENVKLEKQKESISAENAKFKLVLANCEHTSKSLMNDGADGSDDFKKLSLHHVTGAVPLPASSKVEFGSKALHEKFLLFFTLKERLQKAEKIAEEIEMTLEEMQSHRASLSGLDAPASASGVSKLIQAFESKAHDEEQVLGSSTPIEGQMIDPYVLGKSNARSLRALLNSIFQDIEHECHLFQLKKKGQKTTGEVTWELEDGALCDSVAALESRNIELEVLYTVFKQYIRSTNVKAEHFNSHVALQRQEAGIEAPDIQQCHHMMDWCSRINGFQAHILDIRRISGEMGSYTVSEVEALRKDVSFYLHRIEEARQSSLIKVAQMVEKLGATLGQSVTLPSPYNVADNVDVCDHISVSINAACHMVENMREKLEGCSKENDVISNRFEEVCKQFEMLSEENRAAADLLHNVFEDLVHCLNCYGGNLEEFEVKKNLDTLDSGHFDNIMKQLACLLSERAMLIESNVMLKESNDKFQAESLEKLRNLEACSTECVGEDVVMKMLDDVINVLNLQHAEMNLVEQPLPRLQYLVSLLIEKYKEVDENTGLLKNDINSSIMELNELLGTMESLSSSNFEQQNIILVLTESLIQGKQAFDEVRGELQVKIAELGHSENRVASVREKLSIAVAKGKGLIAQRDSLKQEVQLKEAKILEVEERLKVYAEAGERMEALESELSYIRNSATALRESFLLKDSALQRIEEILEDIDLPEHFHSQDIIQKVDYLAKTVVAENSSPLPQWDQKTMGRDGPCSDSNDMVVNGNTQSDSYPLDDLKVKFEELQIRFYELAEQNDMLEQSLMERNNLLQKWEEVLDRIDVPSQLQSMEPEDRIQWLGTAFSEADDHITSLQKKIESLENYCESVTADFQDSERRFSELDSSLHATNTEKEKLYGEIESLTFEHERLLKEVTQSVQKFDDLQHEMDALQKDLLLKSQVEDSIQQTEGAIARVQGLVIGAMPSLDSESKIVDASRTEILEMLIRKLLEDYERLQVEISVFKEAIAERLNEEAVKLAGCNASDHLDVKMAESDNASLNKPRSTDLVEEDLNILGPGGNLDGTVDELACLTMERDGYLETIRSMANQLEELDQGKKELQKLLNQEEEKSASLREKLNVAVRKGKSLVQHRDSLKQLVEEMTSEIDQLKSEKTIWNESVANYDQKIKEMSSELENSAAVKSENDNLKNLWEELRLYLHSLVINGYINNVLPGSNPLVDLKMIFEEQWKSSNGLAEQNQMLEQSLTEMNFLLQQWKEALDRITVHPQLQLMEPEDRIQWLGTSLSEAEDQISTLQKKIESLESYCESLTADMQDSERRFSEVDSSLQAITIEKEKLYREIEIMSSEHEGLLKEVAQSEQKSNDLQSKVDALQKELSDKLQIEVNILQIEGAITRMQDLVIGALPSRDSENQIVVVNSSEMLEMLIRRLLEEYQRVDIETSVLKEAVTYQMAERVMTLAAFNDRHQLNVKLATCGDACLNEPRTRDGVEELNMVDLGRNLDRTMDELACISTERDGYLEMIRSLAGDLKELDVKKKELQKQLNQEEQKSASLREKLNVAVRKGKSLVQHRDSLKQTIEEMTCEISLLKSERITWKESVSGYDQKIKEMSSQLESRAAVYSENDHLKNQLEEYKLYMQEREHTLSIILQKLGEVNVNDQPEDIDPVKKLEGLQKLIFELRAAVESYDQEAKKSKRAVELLLAEMNEVQERNDGLQEEVANAKEEISHLLRQKDTAESSKLEVVSHLNKLCEEQRNQLAFYELFKSKLHETEDGFVDLSNVIVDIFVKDVELLHSLKESIELCLKPTGIHLSISSSGAAVKEYLTTLSSGFERHDQSDDVNVRLQQLITDVAHFKEGIGSCSLSLREEAKEVINIVGTLQNEVIFLIETLDSMKSAEKGRDDECIVIRRMMSLLYEACANSVMEIEQRKSQLDGNRFPAKDLGSRLKVLPLADIGLPLSREVLSSSDENVKNLADTIMLAVREFAGSYSESKASNQEEMQTTISNLQKMMQEKDVKKDEMYNELVSKIKEAESSAAAYLSDLQSAQTMMLELEHRLEIVEKERSSLEKTVIDMQQNQMESVELQEKVSSLTTLLTDKEQEIDSLMQALDEEENQLEGLKKKIKELDVIIERKNLHVEQVEAAHGKALKKLSTTVSRFDELHQMSEGLLTEVEYLQSQLQDRDSEISFLRQEVTKCTNDVLLSSKMAKERNSNELQDLLRWLENTLSSVAVQDEVSGDHKDHRNAEYKEHIKKLISCIVAELEKLQVSAQSKDTLLQAERSRAEEYLRVKEALELSLNQKELHLNSLLGAGEFRQSSSEIVEVEPVVNKRGSPVTVSQVRSLRKGNSDQVSIAIEADAGDSGRLEDEDDDKVHGFKSLTTSRFVPKFTRPVSDMIDGLWVSCDRTLMRQPAFRLGIMLYWAVLHALLATFVF